MKRIICLLAALLVAQPVLAERYKALPTDKDNLQMNQRLMNGEEFLLKPFLANPEKYHWTGFYYAAEKLFKKGRKDEALMWYYTGQIRGRVASGLDPDPSRNNALLTSLAYGIGQPIMKYAHGDKDAWLKAIDAALAWDKAHPMPADPVQVIGISDVAWDSANFQIVYDQVRTGLATMRAGIADE